LAGEEGDRWSNPDQGEIGKEMVPGAGESDIDGAEAAEEGICDDSGVLVPAVVSPAFEKIQNRALGSKFPRDVGGSKWFRLCILLSRSGSARARRRRNRQVIVDMR
jgi:hypothetical protein